MFGVFNFLSVRCFFYVVRVLLLKTVICLLEVLGWFKD